MNSARFELLLRKAVTWSSTVFLVLLIVVPIAILTWLLFFTKTFAVTGITVVDARPHTEGQVREIAHGATGKNILFLSTPAIEQTILQRVPQVRTIHIVRKLPGTLKVIVQEKTPVLLLLSHGSYYFVDVQGVAYENASLDVLPGVVLPTVKNADDSPNVTLGARAVDESFVEFSEQVRKALPDITAAHVVEMRIPSLAAREVHFLLDKNWKIMMDTTRPAAEQLQVLTSLLEHTVTAEEQQTLEYIDLRIPNRVYYKASNSRTTTSP